MNVRNGKFFFILIEAVQILDGFYCLAPVNYSLLGQPKLPTPPYCHHRKNEFRHVSLAINVLLP